MAKTSRIKQLQTLTSRDRKRWQNIEEQAYTFSPNVERDFTAPRSPMIVTSSAWLRRNKYIVLWVNPRQMNWTLPKRETVTKTAAGAVRNTWRNRFRGTYYDEGTLNITFQTGNIMPGVGVPRKYFGQRKVNQRKVVVEGDEGQPVDRYTEVRNTRDGYNADALAQLVRQPPIPPGLENFYDFLGLIDQPILQGWGENRHILLYRTRVFPRMRIEGYFTPEGVTFPEEVSNANKLEWTASFQVYRTIPPFWKPSLLKSIYSDAIREAGIISEVFPNTFDIPDFQRWWLEEKKENLFDPDSPSQKLKTDSGARGSKKKKLGVVSPAAGDKTAKDQETKAAEDYAKAVARALKQNNFKEPFKSKLLAELNKTLNDDRGRGFYRTEQQWDALINSILARERFAGNI